MPSQDTPVIYAELLANIRQLSVAVTLPSPAERSTQGTVSPDGSKLHIAHAGTQTPFSLPGNVVAPRNGVLPAPHPGSRVLSWRLPLSDASAPLARGPVDEPVPWTATDLLPESAVACRGCAATVVPEGTAKEWRDLPSENWAEMMDFWHCHKPTDHEHDHEPEHLAKRGYGANSSIAAQNGVGLVDLTSLLFTEADCSGLVVSELLCFRPLFTMKFSSDMSERGIKKEAISASLPLSDVVTDTPPRDRFRRSCPGRLPAC